jgi:hypothetical protein
MPVPRSTSNKRNREKIIRWIMPVITLRLYGRSQSTLAVAMIHHNLQQVGIKP